MNTTRACVFRCGEDELVGIISPGNPASDVALLIVVGGPQYRVGSHRQFRLLAERLSSGGVPVMRFDQRGTGDSTGKAAGFEALSPDIGAAVDTLVGACPAVKKVVIWGLCDGASAALLYRLETQDARVAGLILLNPWVRSEETLARTRIKHYYAQRILQGAFWRKVLAGEYPVRDSVTQFGTAVVRSMRASPLGGTSTFQARMEMAVRYFAGPILLILSGQDLTAKEFLRYCSSARTWSQRLDAGQVERVDLAEADHTFTGPGERDRVTELTLGWMKRHFCI